MSMRLATAEKRRHGGLDFDRGNVFDFPDVEIIRRGLRLLFWKVGPGFGKLPTERQLQRKTRAASGNFALELPIVFKHEGTMFLDVLIADDASGISGGELDALGALVVNTSKLVRLNSTASFSFSSISWPLAVMVQALKKVSLVWLSNDDAGVTIPLASFWAQQLVGAAMPGLDIAIVLDGGLFFVEQHDGDSVLGIFRKSLVRGRAQPVRGGIGKHAGREPAERCGQRDRRRAP